MDHKLGTNHCVDEFPQQSELCCFGICHWPGSSLSPQGCISRFLAQEGEEELVLQGWEHSASSSSEGFANPPLSSPCVHLFVSGTGTVESLPTQGPLPFPVTTSVIPGSENHGQQQGRGCSCAKGKLLSDSSLLLPSPGMLPQELGTFSLFLGAVDGHKPCQVSCRSQGCCWSSLWAHISMLFSPFFPLSQTRSSLATQEINLLIDLPEGPGM